MICYVFYCEGCNSKLHLEVDNTSSLQSTIQDMDLDIRKVEDYYIYRCEDCK